MYQVKSLKEAIDICLEKYGYNETNIDIIRNLINCALNGQVNYFTRTKGAREYVEKKLSNNGILNELISTTNSMSDDINKIIEDYINMFFRKIEKNKQVYNIKEIIKNESNLDKVKQKIRYISIESLNDIDFKNNLWTTFQNIFCGNDKTITSTELRYDMIFATLEQAEFYRDKATILKDIDPKSTDLTKMDSIKIVEDYIYNDKLIELLELINENMYLAGHLLQNLFDYTYFEKETKTNINSLIELDKELEKITDINIRRKILIESLNYNTNSILNLEPERVLVDVLKNTLSLSIYTNNKKAIDYEERKLYTGESNKEEKFIHNRIFTNNEIANKLIINGKNTSIEDLKNFINNLTDKEKIFLGNIYVISRSLKENKDKLDNSIYYGTNEQIYIYGLLEKEELIESLKEQNYKIVA